MATKSPSAAKKAPAKSAAKTPVKASPKAPVRPAAKPAAKVAAKAAPQVVEKAPRVVEKSPKDPLEKHRKRLLVKQEELLHDLSRNRQVTDESVDEQAQDMVDRATSAYTREFAFSLSESDRRTLLLIDQALLRLDQGTFGTCVHCQAHVQEKRLEAVPWARHCLECQELQDKGLL
ncbi:MAG: TraR/DksA family transcriptional regulator [Thermoanaerobaculia bacterium]